VTTLRPGAGRELRAGADAVAGIEVVERAMPEV